MLKVLAFYLEKKVLFLKKILSCCQYQNKNSFLTQFSVKVLVKVWWYTIDNVSLYALQISWIRLRDWHILTTGVLTYTSDSRFQVLHKEGSYDWVLQIKYVQERDAGEYDCQVRDLFYTFFFVGFFLKPLTGYLLSEGLILKVHVFKEGHKNWQKSSLSIWRYVYVVNVKSMVKIFFQF